MEPWKNIVDSLHLVPLYCIYPTLYASALCWMSYVDIPQDIANALVYLQHHLYKVTKRQNNSETNINNILSTLTA